MDRLLSYWNLLSQQEKAVAIIGIIGAVISGIVVIILERLGKLSVAGLKRVFTKPPPPVQAPQQPVPQPVNIKLEIPQLAPPLQLKEEKSNAETPTPSPEIPRTAAIEFIPRRDKEGHDILALLKEKLAPQNHQLIVLWGPGGVGKTRLATEAAHALKEVFDNHIVWVSADGRPDFNLSTLLDGVATQLDRAELRQLALEPKKEQVRELIASAPTLIVLDNFETITAEEQKRCSDFLAEETSCPALITTRAMIASNLVHNIPIDAMSPDEAQRFLDELIVQAPDRDAFTEENRQRIIQTSTAIPLVMQWVVQQIIATNDPQDVFDKVSKGVGDAAKRVFENSFKLLDEDGRAALLALSLFTPSASRLALTEVAGFGSDVERLNRAATSLGTLRLVRTTDGGKRLLIEGLTRDLAQARLMRGKHADEFRQRFIAFFVNYGKAHMQPKPEAWDALETEKDNLLNAMDVAFKMDDWMTVMLLMGAINYDGVNGLLMVRGYWDEAIRRGEQALEAARNLSDENVIPSFAHNLAITYQFRGEIEAARQLYKESLEIDKKLGNQSGIASTLHELGRLAQGQGEIEEARRLYKESLEINKKLGNQSSIANTLHQLATLAQEQGEIEEARRLYNESLEIKKKFSNQSGIAITLHQLAMLAQDQGEIEAARQLYKESLEINKKLGNQSVIAATLHQLGRLAQEQGEIEEARRLYNESLEIKKKLGNQSGIAITLHNLAVMAMDQGELVEARRLYGESLEITERLGDKGNLALIFYNLGVLAEKEGNKTEAKRLWDNALAVFEKLKSRDAEKVRRALEWLEGKS